MLIPGVGPQSHYRVHGEVSLHEQTDDLPDKGRDRASRRDAANGEDLQMTLSNVFELVFGVLTDVSYINARNIPVFLVHKLDPMSTLSMARPIRPSALFTEEGMVAIVVVVGSRCFKLRTKES